MRLAGNKVAHWREAGQWWVGEPQRTTYHKIDEKGILRERSRELTPLGSLVEAATKVETFTEDHSEEISLRMQKARDEKVARACGLIPNNVLPHLRRTEQTYAALHVHSGYSFGRSSMMVEEIAPVAALRGISEVLLADHFSLAGVMDFCSLAEATGVRPLIGATFELDEGGEIVLVARSRQGFRSLSRLITDCHLNEPRLFPLCTWKRLEKHREDLLCLTGGSPGPLTKLVIGKQFEKAQALLKRLVGLYGRENVFVQIERSYLPWEIKTNEWLLQLAKHAGVVPVAGGPITHAKRDHFPAQDTLICIETLCAIEEIVGRKPRRDLSQPSVKQPPMRSINAERFLRTPQEMAALFSDRPDLLQNTRLIAERCEENVLPGRTKLPTLYPNEEAVLIELTYQGAQERHRDISRALHKRLDEELRVILKNGFAGHFLVAWDMCRWAREQQILHSGRGSVVDSAVAYCLGLSRIDAFEHSLHFDRFLPEDGQKRPDIDIDFEAKRRDDVRNYLVGKYGKDNVATVAAYGAFGTRGVIREVGKVMGVPEDIVGYLAKRIHGSVSADRIEQALDAKPELRNSNIPRERFMWVFKLGELLMDIPRNVRAHSSGVVISSQPIADTVPVMPSGVDGVQIIQWDKRAAKKCFDKFDVLCLRGNDALAGMQERTRERDPGFSVEDIPLDDPNVFETMRKGELIGVPQSASPAMRQAHIRIQTQNLKDAGIVQAAIRPGVGGAVKLNQLIARRHGKESFDFLHEDLREILEPTYGIVVFQEQVDKLLQVFGGYTSDEAEQTREAIHKRRKDEYVEGIRAVVVDRIKARGYSEEVANEAYELVAVFKGYGFAEGHALAFAEISIRSIWCQKNYPAEYFAAILDAQPAGYYGPCTLANEARIRNVKVLPPDVNQSELKFKVEAVRALDDPPMVIPYAGIRVSLKQIGGLSAKTRERLLLARENGAFTSIFNFASRVLPDRDELEGLILCGALDSLEPNRRRMLWAVADAMRYAAEVNLDSSSLPLLQPEPELPEWCEDFTEVEKKINERSILDLDVDHHLMAFERRRVRAKGGLTAADASKLPNLERCFVVGNPIRLRFPPTASGTRVMFFDLEDETGLLNVTCFNDTYEKYGHLAICSPYITIRGQAQERDGHIAFLAESIYPYAPTFDSDSVHEIESLPITLADFLVR